MAEESSQVKTPETPPTSSGSAAPTGPLRGNKVVLIIVIVVVVLAVLSFVGWYFAKRAISKVTGVTGNAYSYTSGTDTISAGESTVWPKDIPSTIPKFDKGTIKGSAYIDKTWTITIEGVTAADLEAYKQTLKSGGWTISGEADVSGIKTFIAENSAGQQVSFSLTEGDKAAIIGIVTEKTGGGTATPD